MTRHQKAVIQKLKRSQADLSALFDSDFSAWFDLAVERVITNAWEALCLH